MQERHRGPSKAWRERAQPLMTALFPLGKGWKCICMPVSATVHGPQLPIKLACWAATWFHMGNMQDGPCSL